MGINVILINVLNKLPTVIIRFACVYTCLKSRDLWWCWGALQAATAALG